jgi:hypothetical protein
MFNVISELNWIAISAGTVALCVLGYLWFAVVKFPSTDQLDVGTRSKTKTA